MGEEFLCVVAHVVKDFTPMRNCETRGVDFHNSKSVDAKFNFPPAPRGKNKKLVLARAANSHLKGTKKSSGVILEALPLVKVCCWQSLTSC